MNRKEWQSHYGLTDYEMVKLSHILKAFDGIIVCVVDNPKQELLRTNE